MRIVCIGGGPAGLYFGLLMKQRHPEHSVTVIERNKPYDTFGWGVVFSDAMMKAMRVADPESAAEIAEAFNHWDDIELVFKGSRQRTTGHGFIGIGRKQLLNILQRRSEALGVELVFEREVDSDLEFPDADLIVASDGVNSKIRERYADDYRSEIRGAAQPLHLARHEQAVRRLYLRFPQDRARLVPGAHLQVRQRRLDLHRRNDRGNLRGARPRQARPGKLDRFLREGVRRDARGRQADDQRAASARLGLAQLQPTDLRLLESLQRPLARRADGRRRAYRSFRHRLGHQTRARRCDRARRSVRPSSATDASKFRAALDRLRGDSPGRCRAHPERRPQRDGMVRGRGPPLRRRARAAAVLLFDADPLAAHQPRKPAFARQGLARGLRALVRAKGRRGGERQRPRAAADADPVPRPRRQHSRIASSSRPWPCIRRPTA